MAKGITKYFKNILFLFKKNYLEVVLDPLGMPAPQHLLTPPYLTCLLFFKNFF